MAKKKTKQEQYQNDMRIGVRGGRMPAICAFSWQAIGSQPRVNISLGNGLFCSVLSKYASAERVQDVKTSLSFVYNDSDSDDMDSATSDSATSAENNERGAIHTNSIDSEGNEA